MTKLAHAFNAFDNYNKKDPMYLHGVFLIRRNISAKRVLKLDPNVDEELLLASRSQHIGRWEIPVKLTLMIVKLI